MFSVSVFFLLSYFPSLPPLPNSFTSSSSSFFKKWFTIWRRELEIKGENKWERNLVSLRTVFLGGGWGGWCTSSWERRHKWYIVYEKEQDGLEEERNKSRVEQWLSAEKASFWITDPAPERTWLVATLRVKKRVARFLLKSYPSLASLRELTPEWLPVWALTARQHCQVSDSILAKILIHAHALRGPWPPVSNGSLSFPSVPYAHLLLYFLRSTYPTYCICFIF